MKRAFLSSALIATRLMAAGPAAIAPADLVFAEQGGLVVFEAEHFISQELTTIRAWHLTTAAQRPKIAPDPDGTHVIGASGGAYLELLPDTRWSPAEKLLPGENYTEAQASTPIQGKTTATEATP